MRSMLLKLVLSCGLMAAVVSPALACDFNVNASNDQAAAQHTAQAGQSTETHSN
jgi:hypothetical protein